MPREENIVQKETKPMDQGSDWPDRIEHEKENDTLTSESSGGILSSEKRAIGGSPEQAEVVRHSDLDSLHDVHRKSPFGLSSRLF